MRAYTLFILILFLSKSAAQIDVWEASEIDNYSIIQLQTIENTISLDKEERLLVYEKMAQEYMELGSYSNAIIYYGKKEKVSNPNFVQSIEASYLNDQYEQLVEMDLDSMPLQSELITSMNNYMVKITGADEITSEIKNLNQAYASIELLAYGNDYVEMVLSCNKEGRTAEYRPFAYNFSDDFWQPVKLDTTLMVLRRAYQIKYTGDDGKEIIKKIRCSGGCSFEIPN